MNPPLWSLSAVSRVLGNPVYIGNMVQGRQRSQNYKTGKVVNVPKDEWIIVERTHPPIIPKDLFSAAQEKLLQKCRPHKQESATALFSGLVRCAQCHKAMTRKSASRYAYYRCRTYCEQSKSYCSGHSIREDKLTEIITHILRIHTQMISDTTSIQKISHAPPMTDTYETQLERLVEQQQRHLQRISRYKKNLYQDWRDGVITKEEFDCYRKEYRAEIEETERALAVLTCEKDGLPNRKREESRELSQFLSNKILPEVTHGVLTQLIEKIEVDQAGDVTIRLRFKDPFLELIVSQ